MRNWVFILIFCCVGLGSIWILMYPKYENGAVVDNALKVPSFEQKSNVKNRNKNKFETDYFVNDSVYEWSDQKVDWVAIDLYENYENTLENIEKKQFNSKKTHKITWAELMDIDYRLRHFRYKQIDMFAPVFGSKLKSLDNQEVIIEGFVIPIDEDGEVVALSANSYAACFFCGNASPASVISMYMKDKEDSFELDDFRKFKGRLKLNHNDPDQFYYILENAEEL